MEVALYAKSLTRTELQKYGYDDLEEFLEELALLYSLKEEDQNSATFKCEDLNQFISHLESYTILVVRSPFVSF